MSDDAVALVGQGVAGSWGKVEVEKVDKGSVSCNI